MATLANGNAVVVGNVTATGPLSWTIQSFAIVVSPIAAVVTLNSDIWPLAPNQVELLSRGRTAADVAAHPDGGFVVAGSATYRTVNNSDEGLVSRFDARASAVWHREFGDPAIGEQFLAVDVDAEGNTVAVGLTPTGRDFGDPYSPIIAEFNSAGTLTASSVVSSHEMEHASNVSRANGGTSYVVTDYALPIGGGFGIGGTALMGFDLSAHSSQANRCDAELSHPFDDLAAGRISNDVSCIFELGVTTGTTATTYGPGATIDREQMAAFLARLYRRITGSECVTASPPMTQAVGSASQVSIPFDDVPETSFARHDVACIYYHGITTGVSQDFYGSDSSVTRTQMAAFLARLYRLLTGDPCTGHPSPFDDVSPTEFSADDIGCLFNLGITTGTGPSTYDPTGLVTRGQMASFLARLYRLLI